MKKNAYFKFHVPILLAGDIFVFAISLISALYIRYNLIFPRDVWESYKNPFTVLALLWIFLFLIADFYNPRKTFSFVSYIGNFTVLWLIWIFLSFSFFYIFPFFGITPKIVLMLDAIILYVFSLLWRNIAHRILSVDSIKFVLFGFNTQIKELLDGLYKNKSNVFKCVMIALEPADKQKLDINQPYMKYMNIVDFSNINREIFEHHNVDYIITSQEHMQKTWADFFFRELFPMGIKIEQFHYFFERVMQKVPVQSIDTVWFLENVESAQQRFYDVLKRTADIFMVFVLAVPVLITAFFVILTLIIENKTKVFYIQNRIKKNGVIFKMYKFASMVPDAEKHGPQWSTKGDSRVTKVGKVIRNLHFDEIPQLINILKGDMSFIGPRPERPEFVEKLGKEIPFYYQRFLVKPGLSGWAQLNYPYGETVEDALHKLQYDLFYIKHRSVLLDLEIFLRSFRLLFFQPNK